MDIFETDKLLAERSASGKPWLEFLRKDTLSAGLYVLPAGGTDNQLPHTEDEVYYVVSGQGVLRVGEENQVVRPGSIIFVGSSIEHRFHSISEELKILVLFAPAEYSRAGGKPKA